MRVVGGMWRGKALEAPEGRDVTRPTTDRVREAMASMVLSAFDLDLSGVSALDAFAGSGALGIEMLSRGAAHATLVDVDRASCARMRRNLASVGAAPGQAGVVCGDVRSLAQSGRLPSAPFDLVMLDPPYATPVDDVRLLVCRLAEQGLLAERAFVLYERASSGSPLEVEGATMVKQKRFGSTCVDFLKFDRR